MSFSYGHFSSEVVHIDSYGRVINAWIVLHRDVFAFVLTWLGGGCVLWLSSCMRCFTAPQPCEQCIRCGGWAAEYISYVCPVLYVHYVKVLKHEVPLWSTASWSSCASHWLLAKPSRSHHLVKLFATSIVLEKRILFMLLEPQLRLKSKMH